MSDQSKTINSKTKLKGWVERRLYDTAKLRKIALENGVSLNHDFKYKYNFAYICRKIIESGFSEKTLARWVDQCAKPMFANNFLWSLLKRFFNVDLRIPFLTGYWTTKAIRHNTITNVGKQIAAQQLGGTTTAPVTAIAIGIGTPSATALGSEIATGGGERGAATVSNQTTTTTGDTERWIKTFTFTSGFAITEEGLFDNNVSGGNMLASQSFAAVNVVNTDTFQVTHNVQVT